MSRPTLQTTKRSDRRALVAGAVASVVVHAVLFAPVAFDVPRPAAGDLPERAAVLADDAPRLIVLRETLRPQSPSEPSEPRPEAGPAASSGAAAPGAPPNAASPAKPAGARAPSPPPVLLAYAAPVRSALLMAAPADAGSARAEDAAAESGVAETTAAAPAATYTPGGVRSAKLGWSGQDAAKARRDKRIRSALAVEVGGGHCPARPPSRGPLGL